MRSLAFSILHGVISVWAGSTSAEIPMGTSLEFIPFSPRPGEPVLLHLSGTWPNGCVPVQAQIAKLGNTLFVSLITQVEINPHVMCTMALTPWELEVPLGSFDAGTYIVSVTYRSQILASALLSVSGESEVPETLPNGSFEQGTVGGLPEGWSLGEAFIQRSQRVDAHPAEEHVLRLSDRCHFDGARSLYGMAKAIPPQETSHDPALPFGEQFAYVWASSDWVSAPSATVVELYMRDVKVEGNTGWGYGAYILLVFEDEAGLYPNPFARWDVVWNSPQLLYGVKEALGTKDAAMGEEGGSDGGSWKLYRVPIPEEVDRERFNVKIFWIAHNWNSWGPEQWIGISSYIDLVGLSAIPVSIRR
ncbi:MAG: hypothetical protein J7J22_05035 [Candidatus Verstraetearchaeota archaeon]|nr:hypothetical protein [Candidatus Verstraetearchaeota archaeon]